MLGFLGLKDTLYLAAIAVVVGGLLWWHHTGVLEGEARIRAADVAAEARAQAAAETQKRADEANAEEAIHGLQAELAAERAAAGEPAPIVRVCHRADDRGPAAVPAGHPGGTEPGPAAAGGVPGVPDRTAAGPDIGPGLQHLADACEVISARERATLRWARGLSETGPRP